MRYFLSPPRTISTGIINSITRYSYISSTSSFKISYIFIWE
nr:MAG TPA: hypothetical protein [Bacteriophage sp.]